MFVKKIIKVSLIISAILLSLFVAALTFLILEGYYSQRNVRKLVKHIEKTEWQDYSYELDTAGLWAGYFHAEVWGPNDTYLSLTTIFLDNDLEDASLWQLNDAEICKNGNVKFVSFVESQTGDENLSFSEALQKMDSAYKIYKSQLDKGLSPSFPREFYSKEILKHDSEEIKEYYTSENGECKSEIGVKIPERIEKTPEQK